MTKTSSISEIILLMLLLFTETVEGAVYKPASKADLVTAIVECLKLSDDCSQGAKGPIGDWDVSAVTDMSHAFY